MLVVVGSLKEFRQVLALIVGDRTKALRLSAMPISQDTRQPSRHRSGLELYCIAAGAGNEPQPGATRHRSMGKLMACARDQQKSGLIAPWRGRSRKLVV